MSAQSEADGFLDDRGQVFAAQAQPYMPQWFAYITPDHAGIRGHFLAWIATAGGEAGLSSFVDPGSARATLENFFSAYDAKQAGAGNVPGNVTTSAPGSAVVQSPSSVATQPANTSQGAITAASSLPGGSNSAVVPAAQGGSGGFYNDGTPVINYSNQPYDAGRVVPVTIPKTAAVEEKKPVNWLALLAAAFTVYESMK